MKSGDLSDQMKPVAERLVALDALRGAALFGVLLVNLEVGFRVSLFQQMLTPHTHAGWANRATDILIAGVFEFKAFTLFAFLFGVGVGVQTERTATRQHSPTRFLARRFGVLLVIGLSHMLLLWNGDILTLYAVCDLLLIPVIALSARGLAMLGLVLIVLAPYLPFFSAHFPAQEALRAHAAVATRVYATGSFTEIMALRWHEAGRFIAPLLLGSLPRTVGLMMCGLAAWRGGVLPQPLQHRTLLKRTLWLAGTLGALMTTLQLWANETGRALPAAFSWLYPYDFVLLAAAYGAGLWLWLNRTPSTAARWLAAGGRMALSNYLAQSVLFSLLFYGFGLGWFGKLGSTVTALLGVTVFILQLAASVWWLRRYQFGPAEWLWRSLTYGQRQPFHRVPSFNSL
ncbi:MAG: DUF418 domain-containing protein [Acidobacteria bacterium]|nr:DUF418 domain-containing protein [Acidobacteriota bacterium]MBI3423303.1 DUF418 domain-containing protein [Acidobacteriota bacterium]